MSFGLWQRLAGRWGRGLGAEGGTDGGRPEESSSEASRRRLFQSVDLLTWQPTAVVLLLLLFLRIDCLHGDQC